MKFKVITFLLSIIISAPLTAQTVTDLNMTGRDGKKQGHWLKKYPNGNTMYDGFFKDDKPVGEFKRYYEDNTLKSVLVFRENGTEAAATLYHPNGYIASKGEYNNQLKEGKWQFFSSQTNGVIVSEESFLQDRRNGESVKFYSDSTIAEKINYVNGVRHGEWIKYHPNGAINFKTTYSNGRLNGKFEAFFENSKPEIVGRYADNRKDGLWIVYDKSGNQRFSTNYVSGTAENHDIDIYESNYIDSLERKRDKTADPENTGKIW